MGDTIAALAKGQVDRLLLSASIDSIIENETLDEEVRDLAAGTLSPGGAGDPSGETRQERLAGLLVKKAEETGVRVTFVEQTDLMTGIGGVGAFLRYRA
jgi:peptide subunit release factor 1 (eRF1)